MYKISGFADEIDSSTDIQFNTLNEIGIKFFEPRGIDGKNISDLTNDEAYALCDKMDSFGICASSVGSPIGKIMITDDFEPHKEKLLRTIEIAKILRTKYIRMFSFYIPDGEYEKYRSDVMERLQEMAAIAEENDVVLLHENEKGVYGDMPERCLDIFKTIKSKHLRGVFDMANFVQCGVDSCSAAFDLLCDNIEYMHIKDAVLANGKVVPAGMGDGNIREIVKKLKERHYDGFFSLEPHLGSFEGLADLELGDEMMNLPKGGKGTFVLAYQSFKKILEEV